MNIASPKDTLEADIQIDSKAIEESDKHYLNTVSKLGDSEDVTASQDVFSDNGVLLIAKGGRIDRKTYSKLVQHRLRESVDNSLSIGDCISNSELFADLNEQLERHQPLTQMIQAIPNTVSLRQCLQHIFLNNTLRNKVSIAKKAHPELYKHSLRVSIGAAIMGFYLGLSRDDCDCLATAGLIHDLGHMHMDNSTLRSGQLLLAEQKQIIYAHPVIMFLLLKDSDAYHPKVSMPVLEHHERTWGTGYPRGIEQYHSKLSAVLAMTETMASLMERQSISRVFAVLKSHDNIYDKDLIRAVTLVSLQRGLENSDDGIDESTSHEYLALITSILDAWAKCQDRLDEKATSSIIAKKIDRWMYGIEKAVARSGIVLSEQDPLATFKDDSSTMQEVHYHLDELLYTLSEVSDFIERDKLKDSNSLSIKNDALAEWTGQLKELSHRYKASKGVTS